MECLILSQNACWKQKIGYKMSGTLRGEIWGLSFAVAHSGNPVKCCIMHIIPNQCIFSLKKDIITCNCYFVVFLKTPGMSAISFFNLMEKSFLIKTSQDLRQQFFTLIERYQFVCKRQGMGELSAAVWSCANHHISTLVAKWFTHQGKSFHTVPNWFQIMK